MRMNPLGRTGISVSEICLGTMTFGEQNTEVQAFQQLDMAFGRGVNFIDTAEMYSFPARTETQGRTEEIIGNWMRARGNRERVVLATKITGPGLRFEHIRGGDLKLGREQIRAAIDLSLKRLKTDYIDLYQTHGRSGRLTTSVGSATSTRRMPSRRQLPRPSPPWMTKLRPAASAHSAFPTKPPGD